MENQKIITITDGVGTSSLSNGTYSVSSSTIGYSDATILPVSQEIEEGIDTYDFTISATGTLTFHVTEDGTSTGTNVSNATFYRCDSLGTTYGQPKTSSSDGLVVFNNVPFSEEENRPIIYYKQTASDSSHTFDDTLKNITLDASTKTIEITNALAPTRTINLKDANYEGLKISSGEIILEKE